MRWISALLENGIYSDLDTLINFQKAPNIIWQPFLIPFNCEEEINFNNNFIAAAKECVFLDKIRDDIIQAAEELETKVYYPEPRAWVHKLFGPVRVQNSIFKHFLNFSLEDIDNMFAENDKTFWANLKKISEKIDVGKTCLFKNSTSHNWGAGDISWATDSQEKMTKEYLTSGLKILTFWNKNKSKAGRRNLEMSSSRPAPIII